MKKLTKISVLIVNLEFKPRSMLFPKPTFFLCPAIIQHMVNGANRAWWQMPVIQKYYKFKSSLALRSKILSQKKKQRGMIQWSKGFCP